MTAVIETARPRHYLFMRSRQSILVVSGLVSTLACNGPSAGDEIGDGDSDSSESDSGESDSGESDSGEDPLCDWGLTSGVPSELLEPEVAPDCELIPGDHDELCGDGPCPIVDDVELHCDDIALGSGGVSAGVDAERVYTTAQSDAGAWLISAVGDQGELEELPRLFGSSRTLLAQAPSGEVHLAANRSEQLDGFFDSQISFLRLDQPGFVSELLHHADPNASSSMDRLEFDYEGMAHAWFTAQPFQGDKFARATRHGKRLDDASWWFSELPVTADFAHDFALTPAGESIGFDFDFDPFELNSQLVAHACGETRTLGDPIIHDDLRVPRLPLPGPLLEGPDYLVAVRDEPGVRLLWPQGETWAAFDVPGTSPNATTCPVQACPCTQTCHDTGVGLPGTSYAIARTSDGVVWVAWLTRENDIEWAFSPETWPSEPCHCKAEVVSDESRTTLHLGRIDSALTSMVETLTMPVARAQVRPEGPTKTLDLVSYGDRLGLAITSYEDSSADPKGFIRLIGIDTEALPVQ